MISIPREGGITKPFAWLGIIPSKRRPFFGFSSPVNNSANRGLRENFSNFEVVPNCAS